MKTVNFDVPLGLGEENKDTKNSEITKKSVHKDSCPMFLPRMSSERRKDQIDKRRIKGNKRQGKLVSDKRASPPSPIKLSNVDGLRQSLNFFPGLSATSKEIRETLEKMETSFRISTRRSCSAPHVKKYPNERLRRTTRFPVLAKRKDDVTAENCCLGKLVVEGKKLSESSGDVDTDKEEITIGNEKSSNESGSSKREEDICDDALILRIGFHDNRAPELPVLQKAVRSSYSESSVLFNTYLQSRFGKSVFTQETDQARLLGEIKRSHLDWAPLLIRKHDLIRRSHVFKNSEA